MSAMLPTSLETERLRLRLPRAEDVVVAYSTYCSDPGRRAQSDLAQHRSVDDTRVSSLAASSCGAKGRGHLPWIVERKSERVHIAHEFA
ncbi:MAG: hypothetical protein M5T61_18875 [Acidimicrobiia bacterium]|nr:hypothetical protein [Acidimicrobiia bacterium]